MSNRFESFAHLPIELQNEAIREGEVWLNAQLHAATAADQRALTWGGFLIASATASLGGGIALITKSPPDHLLAGVAILFSGLLLYASYLAVLTVKPALFCFPGNRPGHWLPEHWASGGTERVAAQRARIDQARTLDDRILENRGNAEFRAETFNRSIKVAFATVAGGGVLLVIILAGRVWTIEEPTSNVVRQAEMSPATT
jgi:hypothetical protein